jgi:hypothetical protein
MAQQCASDMTLLAWHYESGHHQAIPDSALCNAHRQ